MPTLNQAAYVGESRGMRKAKRLGGEETIIRPRAPEFFYQSERGIPNDYDLRFNVPREWQSIRGVYCESTEAVARAQVPSEFRETLGEGIARGLAEVWREGIWHGRVWDAHIRLDGASEAEGGAGGHGFLFGQRTSIQHQPNELSTKARGHRQGTSCGNRSKQNSHTFSRVTSKAAIGAAWKAKESWLENQCNQASEKEHEIVCSYANNKRKKHRIKSRCDNTRTNNNALVQRLNSRGNVKTFSGGNLIMQEIAYNDSSTANVNSYSGFELINIQQNSPISGAQFAISQYASAVTMSGLEMLQNSLTVH